MGKQVSALNMYFCQRRWIIFTRFSKCKASQEWAGGELNLHIFTSRCILKHALVFLSIFSGFSWSVLIQLFLAPFHQEESLNYITTWQLNYLQWSQLTSLCLYKTGPRGIHFFLELKQTLKKMCYKYMKYILVWAIVVDKLIAANVP